MNIFFRLLDYSYFFLILKIKPSTATFCCSSYIADRRSVSQTAKQQNQSRQWENVIACPDPWPPNQRTQRPLAKSRDTLRLPAPARETARPAQWFEPFTSLIVVSDWLVDNCNQQLFSVLFCLFYCFCLFLAQSTSKVTSWWILTTRQDDWMSRVSISHFGRSGNLNLEDSNPGQVKPMAYKIDTCHFLARRSTVLW